MVCYNVIDSWTEALDDGLAVHVIYLDFMKAFDSASQMTDGENTLL